MEPIFRNSEPAHRAPLSQWQRERMGRVHPAHTSNREAFWTCVLVFFVVVLIVGMAV